MNLQGFELQAAELGPCLRHWGDMKGADVRESPQGERKVLAFTQKASGPLLSWALPQHHATP